MNYSRFIRETIEFSPQYVFLHTFSHLLIRQLSLYSGYSVSSIKERIYCSFKNGTEKFSGVLVYTASSDSDGSLGGLVRLSEPSILEKLISDMLNDAEWCSMDPFCKESFGEHAQGIDSLNYSACHACTLLPETSCENGNILLDRVSVLGRSDIELVGIFDKKR
jgi:hypothetical protein